MTHLILHKVRGEPAFDVAEKLMIGDEEGWIIPTSGHRAYPWWIIELSKILEDADLNFVDGVLVYKLDTMPVDWPDHYNIDKGEAPKPDFNIMSIITKMLPKVHRRM